MLKLPKNVLTHKNVSALESKLNQNLKLLRPDGRIKTSRWPLDSALKKALEKACLSEDLIQGLEAISKSLDREQKGLKALKSQPGQTQNQRFSRFILLSNDGSERFYHDAESILVKHSDRCLGCVIETSADNFGESFTKKENPAKALMINDRKLLEAFLNDIADSL